MQLSDNTLFILKNFSLINPNLVFRPGNQIKTISTGKNILAMATIAETIPQEFGIYDLNEFLSVVGMFDNPTLEFSDDKSLKFKDPAGKQVVDYFFSPLGNLTIPSRDLNLPTWEIEFTISENELNQLRKAGATLGVTDVIVQKSESGELEIVVKDKEKTNRTSNLYSLTIDNTDIIIPDRGTFSMVYTLGNFKFVAGSYRVKISSKLISQFKHTTLPIEYFVALEKSTTFTS
tara:strand:- start:52 stop:750 length:699 start_codon:yes stop_codon:yes gene_type:complete